MRDKFYITLTSRFGKTNPQGSFTASPREDMVQGYYSPIAETSPTESIENGNPDTLIANRPVVKKRNRGSPNPHGRINNSGEAAPVYLLNRVDHTLLATLTCRH